MGATTGRLGRRAAGGDPALPLFTVVRDGDGDVRRGARGDGHAATGALPARLRGGRRAAAGAVLVVMATPLPGYFGIGGGLVIGLLPMLDVYLSFRRNPVAAATVT